HEDVIKGREHLNFSTWTGGTPHRATSNEIQEICDAVSDGAMPPRRYLLMHPDARLSEAEKETFRTWADQVRSVGR
ncbi:MAG TPA: heme-binding domain-containing protein, partial [Candidatus Acidoferrales bacterium]|nr:heme-binding domain-containing protein [Candidatus Acidoferrales bacterium]